MIRLLLLIIFSLKVYSLDTIPEFVVEGDNEYVVRLYSGDIFKGQVESINDEKSFRMITDIGTTTIYIDDVREITLLEDYYRHGNRVFIMPTARPISNDHFVGLYELAFLYGGVGITDYVSISAGRSFVPLIRQDEQLTVVNAKVTFLNKNWNNSPGGMYAAVGGNISFLNSNNQINNVYVVSTFEMATSSLTAGFIYKLGGEELFTVSIMDDLYNVNYAPGSLGIMLGLEKKISHRNDLYFIGELWNSDISRPSNTGLLGGLRIYNSDFSSEFGLSLFTSGVFAPFVSFNWTPF